VLESASKLQTSIDLSVFLSPSHGFLVSSDTYLLLPNSDDVNRERKKIEGKKTELSFHLNRSTITIFLVFILALYPPFEKTPKPKAHKVKSTSGKREMKTEREM
jgi:hypothetical protein